MWKKYIRKIAGTKDEFVSFDTNLQEVPEGEVPGDHGTNDGDYLQIGVAMIPVNRIKRLRLMCEESTTHWYTSSLMNGIPVDEFTGNPIEQCAI